MPTAVLHAPPATVRPACRDDLARTAEIHRRSLPDGFFARLGDGFVARYHATFAASPSATLVVALGDAGEVIGFLAGTIDNAEHYRTVLRRYPVGLATTGSAALLHDPHLAWWFARTRIGRYSRALARHLRPSPAQVTATGEGPRRPKVGVLTHVAVVEEARGTGAGRALVGTFEATARAAGVDEVRLVTAVDSVGPSVYRRLGWSSRGIRSGADGTVVEEFARRP